MSARTIGISGFTFTPQQMQQIYDEAEAVGLTLREIPHLSKDARLYAGCEALAGDYDLDAVENAPDMQWFHSDWAGVDSLVKLSVFRSGRAILTNSSGAYGQMVAEHALTGCLMLLKNMPAYLDAQRANRWHDPMSAESLWGKKVTVLGVGNVGSSFARMAHGMGAKVSGVDLQEKEPMECLENVYPLGKLYEVLKETEVLVMCLPYTKETERLVDESALAELPPGAVVVNVGRGQTLDEQALAQALRDKRIRGALLDIFPTEPLEADDPLWRTPNLVITPHVAGYADDALNTQRIFEIFRENLKRWGKGQPLMNVVNVERGF